MSVLASFVLPHPPIILPEIGRGEERKAQKTIEACREVARRVAALKPDTIVLTSPHATMYRDYFHISPGGAAQGDLGRFGAPSVSVRADYDTEFVRELSEAAAQHGIPAGTRGERDRPLDHGTLIPLRFLSETCRNFWLVRIGLSGLPAVEHYRLGMCIAQTAQYLGRRAVVIASGDLSHKLTPDGPYGFAPEGPDFDARVTRALASGDFLTLLEFDPAFCESAAECGLKSFQVMAGALDGKAVTSELLSYEGPFGVGYGTAAFTVAGEDKARRFDVLYDARERERLQKRRAGEDSYVRLARLALETFLETGKRASLPGGLPRELHAQRAGVFVSLKKDGLLRGCIGTIEPITGCVAQEILRNAVSSGTEDYRFPPVEREELPRLVYSVDVLGRPEPVRSLQELDAKRYGVIVTDGRRRGLLLPGLEGVNTAEEQISIARQKAGIGENDPYTLERFEVVRHT